MELIRDMTAGITTDILTPLSFVTCLSSDEVYHANLLASPCLGPGSVHEAIALSACASAADGLNCGFRRAKNKWLVCVHQDVYLPEGWDGCLVQQLREAEGRFGPIGVAGVYGVGEISPPADLTQPLGIQGIGWVVDRGRLLEGGPELPTRVSTLDELALVVRRDSGLRFDPALGFHLYGADICLQAHEQGLAVVAVGALCHHNSRTVGLPEAFFASAKIIAQKWSHRLPIATSCAIVDRGGVVQS
jgi:Glycosyltransferase like family